MCCHHVNRRDFLAMSSGILAGANLLPFAAQPAAADTTWAPDLWDPERPFRSAGTALRVRPALMYRVAERREAASWKSWGGVQTEPAAAQEAKRIAQELKTLAADAGFPLDVLPVLTIKSDEEAALLAGEKYDVLLLYPATGSGQLLEACLSKSPDTVLFVRHRSGPVYYWYEALSVRYLSTDAGEAPPHKRPSVHDVVVDDYKELQWRLRALYAVKNFAGTRIVALGGPWGKYAAEAPDVARNKHQIEILDVSYADFEPRLQKALADAGRVALAGQWTEEYLRLPKTTLETDKPFVVNAFLLYGVLKDLMRECDARAFTIRDCMRTIMPMSKTTACLTLSLLNDEGLLAFCESDFVIIPAGILLHHVTGRPVFLHNSTFPHQGIVTCAHCTSPRRMDGARYEPARILTHYESEYGAAPKVEMPLGRQVTFIDPEYATGRWLGFTGVVKDNPFLDICRSQQDVEIQGDWKKLLNEVRDSHWMMAYGDCLDALGYASRRIGIRWESLAEA